MLPSHVATGSGLWAFPLDSYSLPCFLIIHPHYKECRHIHIHHFPGQGEGDLQKQGPSLSGCIISASRRHTQGQFPVSSHLSPQSQFMYSSALLAHFLLLKLLGFCCQSSSIPYSWFYFFLTFFRLTVVFCDLVLCFVLLLYLKWHDCQALEA